MTEDLHTANEAGLHAETGNKRPYSPPSLVQYGSLFVTTGKDCSLYHEPDSGDDACDPDGPEVSSFRSASGSCANWKSIHSKLIWI